MATEVATATTSSAAARVALGEGITPPAAKRVNVKQRRGMLNIHWSPGVKKAVFTYNVWVLFDDGTEYASMYGTSAHTASFLPPASGTHLIIVVAAIDAWGQMSPSAIAQRTVK